MATDQTRGIDRAVRALDKAAEAVAGLPPELERLALGLAAEFYALGCRDSLLRLAELFHERADYETEQLVRNYLTSILGNIEILTKERS